MGVFNNVANKSVVPSTPTDGGIFKKVAAEQPEKKPTIPGMNFGVGPGVGVVDLSKPAVNVVKNTVKNAAETYKNAIPNFLEAASSAPENTPTEKLFAPTRNTLRATASGIDTVFAPVTGAVKAVSDEISDNKTIQKWTQNPIFGKVLDAFGGVEKKAVEWMQKHPEAAKDLGAAGTIALTVAGEGNPLSKDVGSIKGIKEGVVDTAKATKKVVTDIPGDIKANIPHPIENTKLALSKGNATPQLETSVTRVKKPIETYTEYSDMAKKAKMDVKADPPLAKVGEDIGKSFEKVVKQRQNVGKKMGAEIEKIGGTKTNTADALPKFEEQIGKEGVKINEKGEVGVTGQTKMTAEDTKILQKYHSDLKALGTEPTLKELDAFMSRVPKELDIYKSQNSITGTTNAERIIKGNLSDLRENFSPTVTKNKALKPYYEARKAYADLSDFIDEGASFLGKRDAAGNFAKDASIAKSAVQSLLNNGKKDFLIKLEKLTGEKSLDKSIIALQAMRDVGDARGTSLLQVLSQDLPHNTSGLVRQIVDFLGGKAKEKFVGTPEEQTRRFLQSLDLEKPTLPKKAPVETKASLPKTPEVPKKGIIQRIKDTPNKQGGFIKIGPTRIHPDDARIMSDFTDYQAGSYKPSASAAHNLELDAARIAEKYGFGSFKSTQGLANEFGRRLEKMGFKRSEIIKRK